MSNEFFDVLESFPEYVCVGYARALLTEIDAAIARESTSKSMKRQLLAVRHCILNTETKEVRGLNKLSYILSELKARDNRKCKDKD